MVGICTEKGTENSVKDFIQIAASYSQAIISGEIPACQWTIAACERARRDHARQLEDPQWGFRFSPDAANRVCRFIEQLRHTKSSVSTKADETIELLPWQVFILTEIFGWLRKDNGTRRYRRSYIEVGKGNGKSTLAAGIALYMAFCDGEGGADVLCAASMKEQARIVLDTARQMSQKDKNLCKHLGIKTQAHDILQAATQSRMRALPAKASSVEGVSLHCAILDELHAQRGRALYDCLSTATTKRGNSLFAMVTTAGNDCAGIAFELHQFIERLLNQEVEADTFFAILYGIDPADSWDAPIAWQKANPSWGVSVDPSVMAEEASRAAHMPGERQAFRVFHLSEWLMNGGEESFLDFNVVRQCYDKSLNEDEFKDQPCVLGADFANKIDLCSLVRVHNRSVNGKTHFYVFSKNWMPEQTVKNSPVSSLRGWVETGQLISTAGNVVDFDAIEETIVQEWGKCAPRDFNYDPMQAGMLVTHLKRRTEKWDAFVEITQFAKNMTDGMNLLQEIAVDGRLHTNSQVLLWCLANLMHRRFGLHFISPARPKDASKKIDAAVALVMALKSCAACPLDESDSGSPYLKRGIIFI